MVNSVEFHLNGTSYSVQPGTTVLQAARDAGISIPTLCDNASVSPSGSCRLCLVEVDEKRLEPACVLKALDGMRIDTMSQRVITSRRHTIGFLLARAPHNEYLLKLASEYGTKAYADDVAGEDSIESSPADAAEEPRGNSTDNAAEEALGDPTQNNCVLCGLCVRACKKIGVETMQFIYKGSHREVRQISPEACRHCGLCTKLCPTGAIFTITERALVENGIKGKGGDACTMQEK